MKKRMKLDNSSMVKWFIGLLVISFLVSCSGKHGNKTSEGIYYTCSMHPEIKKDEPGNCPICGMKLIEKHEKIESSKDTLHIEVSDLVKPTYEKILSQIELIKPVNKEIEISVNANGIITYDTRRLENISSRFGGRIEKLYVKYLFQPVAKGQKLFDVYSPEMLTEQQNLLFLLANDSTEKNLISAAKQKLSLLGMTENQINEVIKTRKTLTVFSVYSNFSGYVISTEMKTPVATTGNDNSMGSSNSNATNNQVLSVKEGTYIEKGQTLFRLANNEIVWAVLKVYEKDIPLVKMNSKTEIYTENSSLPIFTGITNFIEPFHATNDKTLNVRVYVTNSDKKLKIGQLITGKIFTESKKGLWIPKTAVLDLGMKKIVFVKKQNLFQAKAIETSFEVNNLIQIIAGIDENTEIAINAQYLTDSESFIKVSQ